MVYRLEDEEKRPTHGLINDNTVLQLMLSCRKEGKWDEVPHVDLFFELRNHMKALKDCGLLSRDPSAAVWEKEQPRALRKRCFAGSVGETYIRRAPGKGLELLLSPSRVTSGKWRGDDRSREAEDGSRKSAIVRGGGGTAPPAG